MTSRIMRSGFQRALRAGEDAGQQPLPVEIVLQQRGEFDLVFNDRDLLWHPVI
jgi:hypothetical protein